ncbi:MFS transporter [Shouchella sp. JSM 1781072]|uniref:MFS transporter n=1 Tax=Shouchella sp. JSM 1781072 TaxID=3344581 RepID=UPI0035BEB92D
MSFRSFSRTIQIRLGLMSLSKLTTMMVIPYLIIYFSAELGVVRSGLMFIGVMLSSVAGSVIGGGRSDKVGRKKLILLFEAGTVLAYIGAAFANGPWGDSALITFFFFILAQFCMGAVNPIYQALILDCSHPKERKDIYTYSYWLGNLGVAIGSVIGAFFFFEYLFFLLLTVACASLVTILVTYFFIAETYTPKQQVLLSLAKERRPMMFLLSQRVFLVFSSASLLLVAMEEQLTTYIGVRLSTEIQAGEAILSFFSQEAGGVEMLGLLKVENTVLVLFLTLGIATLTRKWPPRVTLIGGVLLFFSGYVVLSISTTPIILIGAMFIASVGEVLHIPVKQAMLATLIPDEKRSTYMGWYHVALLLGVSSAGIVMIVSHWLSPFIMTVIFSVMGFVSIGLFSQVFHENKERERHVELKEQV